MRFILARCTLASMLAIGAMVFALGASTLRVAHAADAPLADSKTKVQHVDADGAARIIAANRELVVLDLRTPKEFAAGHIAGATNIDFNASGFSADLDRLDKQRAYLVHCASGVRSTRALEVFKKLGFRSVTHLDGGLTAWEKAGRPVTTK